MERIVAERVSTDETENSSQSSHPTGKATAFWIITVLLIVCCGLYWPSSLGFYRYRNQAEDIVESLFPGQTFRIQHVKNFRRNSSTMPGWIMVEGYLSNGGRVEVRFTDGPLGGIVVDNVQINDRIVYRGPYYSP